MQFGLFGSAAARRGGPDFDSGEGFRDFIGVASLSRVENLVHFPVRFLACFRKQSVRGKFVGEGCQSFHRFGAFLWQGLRWQ